MNFVESTVSVLVGYALAADYLMAQPHQARILNALDSCPQNAVIAVDAGGGKTLIAISDIMRNLWKGTVSRPLVMAPSHLVKDYVNEANYYSNGRINVVCITSDTLDCWGEDALLNLVLNAPPNTIFVTDYNFMKNRMVSKNYGRVQIQISLNCELLRAMNFDSVWADEVHYLRKVNQRSISVGRLMSEITGIKRLMSGTLVVDQMTDLANEFGMIDPTVFGTAEKFIEDYALSTSGNKVMQWKHGAEAAVNAVMRGHCMFLTAKRREWAALLPPRREAMHFVEMTPAQKGVYQAILEETLSKIQEEDPDLYKTLQSNLSDDEDSDSIMGMLAPYLARLEQFLTSPAEDEASKLLGKDDLHSPKALKIESIIRNHIDNNLPGKILIFTSYRASAETIYNQLPDDLKAKCIHYTAENKVRCANEFENNSEKRIMVGVEFSMNTGMNLQYASRLIRVESVWSPGTLEQGESRINRPMLKGVDPRTFVWFDWVLVNRTIDITKIGRLIGKLISAAKFENSNETAYETIPDVPLISMTLDSLRETNDYYTTLGDHVSSFEKLRKVQESDYARYRNDPTVDKTFKPVQGDVLPGSAILSVVPYVPGVILPRMQELNLVNYWDYVRDNHGIEACIEGKLVHTELGEGICYGITKNKVKVELSTGAKISTSKLKAFVVKQKEAVAA